MRVSVIIPNYNACKYIGKCLDSVLNQTYHDIEIIVIDDGSTDASMEVLNEYKEKYNNIIVIQQFNQNASIARNRGIEIATGDFLYFLDSDDEVFDKDTIKLLVENIENNDLVIGNYNVVDAEGNFISQYKNSRDYYSHNNKYKYCGISPVPSNKLYRTSLIRENIIYFANVRIGQDLNFYLKYLHICENIKIIEETIYNHRVLKSGMSNSINLNFLDIYNTFLDIRRFYSRDNSQDYAKYISAVAVKHFRMQLSKVSNIKDRKAKRMIYKYFAYCVYDNKKYSTRDSEYKKEFKDYVISKILLKVGIYKKVIEKRNNNGNKK